MAQQVQVKPANLQVHTPAHTDAIRGFFSSAAHYGRSHEEQKFHSADVMSWVQHYRWIYGAPWSYESSGPKIDYGKFDVKGTRLLRPYLKQYVRDQAPIRSAIKPRQSELSVNQINEEMYYLFTRPHTQINHLFPTDDLGDEFSKEKIMTAFIESPVLFRQMRSRAIRTYVLQNSSMLHVSGVIKQAGGRAGSRDINTFDELDKMPESVIGVYNEMLSHSAMQLQRYISTPTTPLLGIDAKVKDGAGWHWYWTCANCKREQLFEWPDSCVNYFEPSSSGFDRDQPEYLQKIDLVYWGCKHCGSYVDRNSPTYDHKAHWVADKPHLAHIDSSYYFTIAMIPWKTGKEIAKLSHKLIAYPQVFHNEGWGDAFIKGEAALDMSEILGCQRSWVMPLVRTANMDHVAMGIDHGADQSWVVIVARGFDPVAPEIWCVVYIEEISEPTLKPRGFTRFSGLEHTDRMKQIIQSWRPEFVVSDSVGIGSDRTISLARSFPRIVWGGEFDTAEMGRQLRQSKLLVPKWAGESRRKVTFSKVLTVKDLMNEVRTGQWGFPRREGPDAQIVDTFFKHLTALGIQPRLDLLSDREYEVVAKLKPGDHLFCAWMYAQIARERLTGFKSTIPGIV